jgi:tripartite-type tricarboxylate transporter receptor subunit TctC
MKRQNFKALTTRFLAMSLMSIIFALPLQGAAFAEDFPTREIEMVINYAAGGGTDMMARLVGDKVSKTLKVPFIYNNKTGGGGAIAANYIANAKPDGYTIGTGGMGNMVTLLAISDKIPYTQKDFTGIARCSVLDLVIMTKKGRFDSFADLVKEAKQKPNMVMYGSYGAKGASHILGELINQSIGIKLKHVPFEGESKEFVAVLGGHIDVAIVTAAIVSANIKNGTITALAVAGPNRSEKFPDVPTLKEMGYPEAVLTPYDGFVTSSKVPADRLAILEDAFQKAINDPAIQESLKNFSYMPGYLNSKGYNAFLAGNLDLVKRTAIKAGLRE